MISASSPTLFSSKTQNTPNPLGNATAQTMRMMLANGMSPHIIADLLAFADVHIRHRRYLSGPIVLSDPPWRDTLPDWLPSAIYADRLSRVLQEYNHGIIGENATPAEILAYLFPRVLDAPLADEWRRVYLWAGQSTLPRHNQMALDDFTRQMNAGARVILSPDERLNLLDPLARNIRDSVIERAQRRDVSLCPMLPAPSLFLPSLKMEGDLS